MDDGKEITFWTVQAANRLRPCPDPVPVHKADSIPDQWTALTSAYKTSWCSALQGRNNVAPTPWGSARSLTYPHTSMVLTERFCTPKKWNEPFCSELLCFETHYANYILLQPANTMQYLFSANTSAYCLPALWEDWIQDCRLCHWQGGSSVL